MRQASGKSRWRQTPSVMPRAEGLTFGKQAYEEKWLPQDQVNIYSNTARKSLTFLKR